MTYLSEKKLEFRLVVFVYYVESLFKNEFHDRKQTRRRPKGAVELL